MNVLRTASVSASLLTIMDPVGLGTNVSTAFVSVGVSLPPPGEAGTTLKFLANNQVWYES